MCKLIPAASIPPFPVKPRAIEKIGQMTGPQGNAHPHSYYDGRMPGPTVLIRPMYKSISCHLLVYITVSAQ